MKKTIIFILFISMLIFLTSSVYSYYRDDYWECTSKGEASQGDAYGRRTGNICGHTCCMFCVATHPMSDCFGGDAKPMCSCTSTGIGDTEPPVVNMTLPKNNSIHSEKKVPFEVSFKGEQVQKTYYSIDGGSSKWLCHDCKSYKGEISIKDGQHTVEITAEDYEENSASKLISIFVDTKEPKIKKTEPKKGLTNGTFNIEFSEENPKSLVLYYGNSATGYKNKSVYVKGVACSYEKTRALCTALDNLGVYNNQNIEYWFILKDIVDQQAESKHISLEVDTVAPVISNWPNIYTINGRYVTFRLEITEKNFEEINYMSQNALRPRWQTLCSRLKDGICEKKVSFKAGEHVVDIEVLDKAGNKNTKRVSFTIS